MVMERLVVLIGEGEIDIHDLPNKMRGESQSSFVSQPQSHFSENGINLNTAVTEFEKNLIYQSLEKSNWVKNQAAKLLNVKRTTLVEKIKRYEIRKCA